MEICGGPSGAGRAHHCGDSRCCCVICRSRRRVSRESVPLDRGVARRDFVLPRSQLLPIAVSIPIQTIESQMTTVPASMEEEGGGPKSPFGRLPRRPASRTDIPSNYFLESRNAASATTKFIANGIVRRTISQVSTISFIEVDRVHAGRTAFDQAKPMVRGMSRPRGAFLREVGNADTRTDRYAGSAGGLRLPLVPRHLACRGTMGNADYTLQYNALHDLAVSDNPVVIRWLKFLTYVNPEPHRRTFMKPFMRDNFPILLGVPQGSPGCAGE